MSKACIRFNLNLNCFLKHFNIFYCPRLGNTFRRKVVLFALLYVYSVVYLLTIEHLKWKKFSYTFYIYLQRSSICLKIGFNFFCVLFCQVLWKCWQNFLEVIKLFILETFQKQIQLMWYLWLCPCQLGNKNCLQFSIKGFIAEYFSSRKTGSVWLINNWIAL